MPSENDYFITIGHHVMKSTALGQSLLSLSRIQMNTHLCQRIVVLTPAVSYSKITNTPENVDVVSNHSH